MVSGTSRNRLDEAAMLPAAAEFDFPRGIPIIYEIFLGTVLIPRKEENIGKTAYS